MASPPPIVYAITPNKIPAAGGRIVQVVGRNLDLTSTWTIGGGPVNPIQDISTFFSQGGAPAHAAGPADLVVNNSGGSVTVTGGITYI